VSIDLDWAVEFPEQWEKDAHDTHEERTAFVRGCNAQQLRLPWFEWLWLRCRWLLPTSCHPKYQQTTLGELQSAVYADEDLDDSQVPGAGLCRSKLVVVVSPSSERGSMDSEVSITHV
jgi:hypothetical protein